MRCNPIGTCFKPETPEGRKRLDNLISGVALLLLTVVAIGYLTLITRGLSADSGMVGMYA